MTDDYGKICPICSDRIRTNDYGLKEHIMDTHSFTAIIRELLRQWKIISGTKS